MPTSPHGWDRDAGHYGRVCIHQDFEKHSAKKCVSFPHEGSRFFHLQRNTVGRLSTPTPKLVFPPCTLHFRVSLFSLSLPSPPRKPRRPRPLRACPSPPRNSPKVTAITSSWHARAPRTAPRSMPTKRVTAFACAKDLPAWATSG